LDEDSATLCLKSCFLVDLSVVIADILCLALFDCPGSLLVSNTFIRPERNAGHEFVAAINIAISKGMKAHCSIRSILHWSLQLVGHDTKQAGPWIISSYKGQAVWPTIYETKLYGRQGYLSLSWLPGLLLKGESHHLGVGPLLVQQAADPITNICKERVSKPRNLCSDLRTIWQVTSRERGLEISLGLKNEDGTCPHVVSNPTCILANLANALLVEKCAHSSDADLDVPDRFCSFTGPLKPLAGSNAQSVSVVTFRGQFSDSDSKMNWTVKTPSATATDGPLHQTWDESEVQHTSIVAVDGQDELRFFALSHNLDGKPVVLRKSACLACCLRVCRRAGSAILVL
jgi:hypothetical protein